MTFRQVPMPKQRDFQAQRSADEHGRRSLFDRSRFAADSSIGKFGAGGSVAPETVQLAGTGGQATIYHGLGHEPQGFRVVDLTSTGTINGSIKRVSSNAETIVLQNDATVAVTAKVEVF